jgi:hypothetical protein
MHRRVDWREGRRGVEGKRELAKEGETAELRGATGEDSLTCTAAGVQVREPESIYFLGGLQLGRMSSRGLARVL